MYKIISTASYIIRTFCLENPFECFGVYGFWINIIVGMIMYPISYWIVGTIYNSGDCPPLGSAMYFAVYFAIHCVLMFLGKFSFAWWSIALIIIIPILLKFTIDKLFFYN